MSCAHPAITIPREHIARSFGRAVNTYDQCAELQREVALHLLAKLELKLGLDSMPGPNVERVLDAGCGTGFCTAALQTRYPDAALIALDLAAPMLRMTQQRSPNAASVCADIQQLPLRAAQFDLVVSSLTIQWCNDLTMLFNELYRVTRPGGHVLLSTFGPSTLSELRKAWANVDTHRHTSEFASADTLRSAARHAGFRATLTSELRTQHYSSMRVLSAELKGLGAHNLHPERQNGLTSPSAFKAASSAFAAQGQPGKGTPVSWEIFYLELQKPHDDHPD